MGKNFLSATELIHTMIAELKPLAGMVSPEDRLTLKRFYEYALNNRAAIANATNLLPLETTLLIILLEEHKRNSHIFNELHAEIAELKGQREQLQKQLQIPDHDP